jgi:hypothetical protein
MWNPSPNRQRQSQLLHDCSPPHQWQSLYRAAILETDPSFVRERINRAERAIADRRHELAPAVGQYAEVEREAMEDALYTLSALKTAQQGSSADLAA